MDKNQSKRKSVNKSNKKMENKTNQKTENKSENKPNKNSSNSSTGKLSNKSDNKLDNNISVKKSANQSKISNQIINKSDIESDKQSDNQSQAIQINEEAKTYFQTKAEEEESPIELEVTTNIRYYNLELVFNSFYPIDSLPIAKDISKEERVFKKIKDQSFTYGEIVNKIYNNYIN